MRVLQAVAIASRSGRFGGPFDTSLRQGQLVASVTGRPTSLLAGHLLGDEVADWPDDIRYVGAPVRHWLPSPGFTGFLSWRYLAAAWREVGRADLVHLSVSRELISVSTLLFCLLRRTTVVAQTHGMLTARSSRLHRLIDLVLRPMARRASSVVALTEVEARRLESWFGAGAPPITVLGNPLLAAATGATAPCAAPEGAVWIARLHPRKRVADFVEAARHAAAQGWSEPYTVVGPDEGEVGLVEAAVASLGESRLRYLGPVPGSEVPVLLRRARVFVLSSTDEAWGNVLAQALAEQVPVVVTRSSALATEVERYGGGLVVPDGDPVAIAEAVHRIVSAPDLAERLAAGGAAFADAVMGDEHQRLRLMAVYEAALTGPGRA